LFYIITANAIKNYIIYLRKECNLSVTLHISEKNSELLPESLLSFNIHDNPYCVCVKKEAHSHCVECQKKVEKKAENGGYTGVCHAGVKEYVYPVFNMEECVGFISVSGYKTVNSDSYLNKISQKYGIPHQKLAASYSSLKDDMPDAEAVNTLIFPLIAMLKLLLSEIPKINKKDSFAEEIKKYLLEHRNEIINSQVLCRHFGCSRSYISRKFNSYTGKTIPQYLTMLRINDAKILLKSSNLSVTQIALSVGYDDSNYFSGIFKKEVGVSPKEYRNKNH